MQQSELSSCHASCVHSYVTLQTRRATLETLRAELPVSQVSTNKVPTWGTGRGGGEEGYREHREPPGPPFSRASLQGGGRVKDVITVYRLLVCVGATAAAAKTTDDLHFLFETFPSLEQRGLPGLRKKKESEARRGTEQKEKGGGMGEKV